MGLTRFWMVKAGNDLKTAQIVSGFCRHRWSFGNGGLYCQQAAEKAVKAFLIWHDQLFPKTHEIESLVEQASTLDPRFEEILDAAELLSPYAWQFRYPGDVEIDAPSRNELDEALQPAQAIYDFVLGILTRETHPK